MRTVAGSKVGIVLVTPPPSRVWGRSLGIAVLLLLAFPVLAWASIVFDGDVSTGDISQYQNWQTQYQDGAIYNEALAPNFSTGPIVTGGYARFSVPAGGARSELLPGVVAKEGADWWVGYWVRLESVNLSASRSWQTIGQFHQTPAAKISTGQPPLRVGIRTSGVPVWMLSSGANVYPAESKYGPSVHASWTHILLHIHWSHSSKLDAVSWWVDGVQIVKAWYPRNGTIYAGDTDTYPKIGLHRAWKGQSAAAVDVAGYTIATTRAEADLPLVTP